MFYQDKLQQIQADLQQLHTDLYSDNAVAKKEWLTLWGNTLPEVQSWQLLLNRLHKLKRISQMYWENPVHVVVRLRQYSQINNYAQAIKTFLTAKIEYEQMFKSHLKGNLTIDCEIGFTVIPNLKDRSQKGLTVYNIHAHIICEQKTYDKYLLATPHLRQGKSLLNHILSSRKCPKTNTNQSNQDYVFRVANYNSKFALLKGQSQRNKKQWAHKETKEYLQLKLTSGFIRVVKQCQKPSKTYCLLRTKYKQAKQWFKLWQQWQLIKDKVLNRIIVPNNWQNNYENPVFMFNRPDPQGRPRMPLNDTS